VDPGWTRDTGVAVPAPVRLTECGPPLALSVMVTAAVSAPAVDGVKITLMVQTALAATVPGQPFVTAKSAALAPVAATDEIVRLAVPVFFT